MEGIYHHADNPLVMGAIEQANTDHECILRRENPASTGLDSGRGIHHATGMPSLRKLSLEDGSSGCHPHHPIGFLERKHASFGMSRMFCPRFTKRECFGSHYATGVSSASSANRHDANVFLDEGCWRNPPGVGTDATISKVFESEGTANNPILRFVASIGVFQSKRPSLRRLQLVRPFLLPAEP